ncbi:MAG: hypothetical protein AB1664_10505 [Thermodesulfobacteriota bacterium]
MNWRDAYLAQAWSDYQIFRVLNKGRYPLCHKLHYLQMATEKLAKGFLYSSKGKPPQKTHYVFVRFLKVSKGRPEWRKKLGFDEHNSKAYATYIDSLIPVADRIEKLAPVGGDFDKVNPEYPWTDDKGDVNCPCRYSFPEFEKTELIKIQKLVSDLFRIIGLH